MKRRSNALLATTALALGLLPATMAMAPAQAAPGEQSIAAVLTSDGNTFDRKNDFDIVTEAALAVLAAKPESPVGVLADGTTRATVFAPTDHAFRLLAKDLTGKTIKSEKKIFNTLVKAAGVDTIESVLLYHVVPGKTLTSAKVLKADGAKVETALGSTVKVVVRSHHRTVIRLQDKDRNDRDARVILKLVDINKGNKQVAHGINRVLRPIDL